MISSGKWIGSGTCAGPSSPPPSFPFSQGLNRSNFSSYPAGYTVTSVTSSTFTLTTSKGPCAVSSSGAFSCASGLTATTFGVVSPPFHPSFPSQSDWAWLGWGNRTRTGTSRSGGRRASSRRPSRVAARRSWWGRQRRRRGLRSSMALRRERGGGGGGDQGGIEREPSRVPKLARFSRRGIGPSRR